MLLLDSSRTLTVDGITVFPDHEDKQQFWYLPGPVQLARRSADNRAAFTCIKYRRSAVETVKGGGFLTLETNLRLTPDLERKILSKLSSISKGKPRLTAVQFDTGTVQCIALNLQGPGGTKVQPGAQPGTFNAVEEILGASVPSMQGDMSAAFSLTLSQEGATLVERSFKQRTTPIGVLYDLKFTGLRPALQVKITADFKRIYQHFSASLSGQYYFVKVGIEAAFEKLVQDGAIKIEVLDFSSAPDRAAKEKEAIDLFKQNLLPQWFEPTLTPGELMGTPTTDNPTSTSTPTPTSTSTPTPETPPAETPTPSSRRPSAQAQTQARTVANADRSPATLTIESRSPDPLPEGYQIVHEPATTGNTETLQILGGATLPTVLVNGAAQTLDGNRRFTVAIEPGQDAGIQVTYPAAAATEETFELLFNYDKPYALGWSVIPPSNTYLSYLRNAPNPADPKFSSNVALSGSRSSRGAQALRDWVANRLASPKEITIEAHASYENKPSKDQHNQALSQRRLDIALGIINMDAAGNPVSGVTVTNAVALGHQVAQAAGRIADIHDRIVKITGKTQLGSTPVTISAKLSRAAQATPPVPNPTPDPTPDPNPTPDPTPNPTPKKEIAGSPSIALKLKFIRQEELKTLTLSYNRSEAVQRTYAPQAFIGLLVNDLNQNEHFLEVDLRDKFFEEFLVTLDAPLDFQKIGLVSAQVALDYGKPNDPDHHRHDDFIFDLTNHEQQQKFQVFMNASYDTKYGYQVQYHFDPNSGWDGKSFSYTMPSRSTEDRTLFINPYDDFEFLDIQVIPNRIDWGLIDACDVKLHYQDKQGWKRDRIITLTATSTVQSWKLRINNDVSDPMLRSYSYTIDYHLKDGSTRKSLPVNTQANAIAISDPFEAALDIRFFPAFDSTQVKMAFVDVTYIDSDNKYKREERLKIMGEATDEVTLRLSLVNPLKKQFQYQVTFISKTGKTHRLPAIITQETLISIEEEG